MVSHPARSQKTQDAALRRLLNKHQLQTIEIIISIGSVAARANPTSWNPIVAERRETAFAGRDHSLAEATRLREEFMKPIARGHGKTIDEAVAHLASELGQ